MPRHNPNIGNFRSLDSDLDSIQFAPYLIQVNRCNLRVVRVATCEGSIKLRSSRYLECSIGIARRALATVALSGLGGEIRIGSSMDTAMMPAITWRPLVYDPLICRICAISKGPNALAEPHAVSI